MSFSGEAELSGGKVNVEGTDIENISGHAAFTNEEALLNVNAEAAGQQINVHGKIKHLLTTPYMDLQASSESFDPALILKNIPYQGAAKFAVKVTGAFNNPSVDGKVQVADGKVMDVPFAGVQADVRYQDKNLFIRDFSAQVFGGRVSGEAVLSTENLGYTIHLKAENIDAAQGAAYLPELNGLTGKIAVDAGGNGIGMDLSTLQLYGSVKAQNIGYQGMTVERASTSFYLADDDLIIDYLTLLFSNK